MGTGALSRGAGKGRGELGGCGRCTAQRLGGVGSSAEGDSVTRSCVLRDRRRGVAQGWASSTAGRNPVSPYCLDMFCF